MMYSSLGMSLEAKRCWLWMDELAWRVYSNAGGWPFLSKPMNTGSFALLALGDLVVGVLPMVSVRWLVGQQSLEIGTFEAFLERSIASPSV